MSLPHGRCLKSQPQGIAPGKGDWEDVSGALIQIHLANLSLLHHHWCLTSHGSVTHSLWASDLLFWSHTVILVHCVLWMLVLLIIRWMVEDKNTEMQSENTIGQKKRVCPGNHRDAGYQFCKSRSCCYCCFRQW